MQLITRLLQSISSFFEYLPSSPYLDVAYIDIKSAFDSVTNFSSLM